MTSSARVRIGHIAIDRFTLAQAVEAVAGLVQAGHGGRVFTPNVDHVVLAETNEHFRSAYARAEVVLADGMPVVWGSRLLGDPLPERVSGADFVGPLLERAAQEGWRVYLLGGAPGVAEATAAILREKPGVAVVGWDDGRISTQPDPERDAEVAKKIRGAQAQVLLVALGAPKQELWIDRMATELGPTVALGIGASLDFICGRVRRSPRWMSQAGLEWLFRLGQEPRRLWRRYLVNDPVFAAILLRSWRSRPGPRGG